MEVHQHAHLPSSKKWKDHIFQFFMLFLAVFCGFLAELQVEHRVEKNREREYIHSMIEDLEKDTANFTFVINGFATIASRFDTVILGFDSGTEHYSPRWTYNFILTFEAGYPDFYYTDRTLQQLKNAGGLRLIKDEKAANGIIAYDAGIKDLDVEERILSSSQQNYIDVVHDMWSLRQMYKDNNMVAWMDNYDLVPQKNYWINTEEKSFEKLYNYLVYFSEGARRQNGFFIDMQKKAGQLIELLKQEYHFD